MKLKYLKVVFLTNAFALLGGCYYKDNCLILPQSVYCMDKTISDFDRYTKTGISLKQKENDIKQCGGTPDKNGNIFGPLRKANSGGNSDLLAVKKFSNCMKNKGYSYTD
ncbi:hypothetical protein [Acinetobacter shaoyimingii]|uniref:Lipoprotein n=1 Tax=Acinetobacter shaoyimingii TaxID=2715164 RepID=A0A6G8RU81_9GAMM|nr:hypothetical protein [Acinetobacter shaoyimingii]QIO05474.1 hypothetical protein G8E00_05660 [Acinetobacter shaoyimingii]